MITVGKAAAAVVMTVFIGAQREFGIGGGAVLCVPEQEIDRDATPSVPSTKHLQVGGKPAFAFQFAADEVRRHVANFSVDPRLADMRRANTLGGILGFIGETDASRYGPDTTCRQEVLRQGPHRGVELKTCVRSVLIDGFRIEYEIQQENAALVPALDQFLRDKVAAWRGNCHATERM